MPIDLSPAARPHRSTGHSLAGASRSLRGEVFALRPGGTSPASGGDERGALRSRVGVFGEAEDVPGDVRAGDGLHGEAGAGLNAPGERAFGQLDGARRVPVERGGGELLLHGLQIPADT